MSEAFKCPVLPKNFTITHHAGALGLPENSLESVEYSVNYGAQIVEFDVTFRKNGLPVIIHSSNPGDKEGASFEKALEIVSKSKDCRINLDIKSTANLPEIDRLCKKYNMIDRVFYTGVSEDWVEIVKKNSDIPYYLNRKVTRWDSTHPEKLQKIADKIRDLGAIGINSHYKFAKKLVSDVMHKNGLLVSFWTVNNIRSAKRILMTCPDNITTKTPDIFDKLMK